MQLVSLNSTDSGKESAEDFSTLDTAFVLANMSMANFQVKYFSFQIPLKSRQIKSSLWLPPTALPLGPFWSV